MPIFFVSSYDDYTALQFANFSKNYGPTYHVKDDHFPKELCGITDKKWDESKTISNNDINKCKVIYLYRNPIESVILNNEEDNIINQSYKTDQYIDHFEKHINYNCNENYDIYYVNYNEIHKFLSQFFIDIGIPITEVTKFPGLRNDSNLLNFQSSLKTQISNHYMILNKMIQQRQNYEVNIQSNDSSDLNHSNHSNPIKTILIKMTDNFELNLSTLKSPNQIK